MPISNADELFFRYLLSGSGQTCAQIPICRHNYFLALKVFVLRFWANLCTDSDMPTQLLLGVKGICAQVLGRNVTMIPAFHHNALCIEGICSHALGKPVHKLRYAVTIISWRWHLCSGSGQTCAQIPISHHNVFTH